MNNWDTVWVDLNIATFTDTGLPYGAIMDAAIAISNGLIVWVGKASELPFHHAKTVSGKGGWMTPGLIDCHTHLIYGGDRIDEFDRRLKGATYEEISRQGGGIMSTVNNTRLATDDLLYKDAQSRVYQLSSEGVTTIEIKSGYGLEAGAEYRMLKVSKQLDELACVDIISTFLGAHAIPPEFSNNREGYLELICNTMIPYVAKQKLASAVDAFCESIAFTPSEVEMVFQAAKAHNLDIKLHAEQLSNQEGAKLAAKYQALSADHLEYLSEDSIKHMAKSGTVAVLLPGAFYMLNETKLPPIDLLRKYGVSMAVASDCNPGTSPVISLRLMINMACVLFKLTPEEALAAVTTEAAKALGLKDRGTIEIGKIADLVIWDITKPAQLAFEIGGNRCSTVIKQGKVVPKSYSSC